MYENTIIRFDNLGNRRSPQTKFSSVVDPDSHTWREPGYLREVSRDQRQATDRLFVCHSSQRR